MCILIVSGERGHPVGAGCDADGDMDELGVQESGAGREDWMKMPR